MPKPFPLKHSKHYARWMGGGLYYYPSDFNTRRFFLKQARLLGVQCIVFAYIAYYFEKRTVAVSIMRPEWHSSYISDLEFNPPLWFHEPPGTIPYFRTMEIEDTWERVEKIRGKHWTDDYVYTKPWESDDGQYRNREPNHKSYILGE